MSKQFLIFFGVGVVAIVIAVVAVLSTTKGSHLELKGQIMKIRTGALSDEDSIAVLDFRVENPSDVPFVVRQVEVSLEKPDGGTFKVSGDHIYAEETKPNLHLRITVTLVDAQNTKHHLAAIHSTAVVNERPLRWSPAPTVGCSGRLGDTRTLVATFIDDDGPPPIPGNPSSEFKGSVKWGDHTFSNVQIQQVQQVGNSFYYMVQASHKYRKVGEYQVILTINHANGDAGSLISAPIVVSIVQ